MVDAAKPRPPTEARPGRAQGVTLSAGKLFERTTVIDSIVAEIKGKILSGELQDGDMLASQDELARALGVSRASLREALSRLSLMGLVETRHGSGTFVKTAKPLDFMNPLTSLLVMDQDSAAELLQARFYIESPVAELAALNATDEQVEQMGNLIERMRVAYANDDSDGYVDLDTRFHVLIAESSGNRVLTRVLEIIRNLLPLCIRRFHLSFPARIPTSMEYHEGIYKAIERRDPVEAREYMEGHIGFLIKLNTERGDVPLTQE